MVAGGSGQPVVAQLAALEPIAPKYVGGYVLLGALLGLLVACWRRDWRMALPAAWAALLVVAVVPYMVGLPGAGVIDTLTGLGTLYIPAALLAGYALASAQGWLSRSSKSAKDQGPRTKSAMHLWSLVFGPSSSVFGPPLARALGVALLLALIAGNAGWQARVVQPETALVAEADLAAIEWVRANTPPDARFLVNSFPAYGGTLVAGTDAGWWLPLLARRSVNVPPLTYGGELGERRGYVVGVNALAKKLRGRDLADPTPLTIDLTRPVALKALKDNAFDYVYSGAHPYPGKGAADRFDTAKLRAHPAFRLVYERDGVEIFQFVGS
jgi:hypothetical protein